MRGGALDVCSPPGAAHRETLRIRGLDQPPRQVCMTPALSSPDSVAEPSPQVRVRPRSPANRRAWCPTKAFATLTFTALAAQAQVCEGVGPHGAIGPWTTWRATEPLGCDHCPSCPQTGHPGPMEWPCWRLASGLARMSYDATLGYPCEGPQLPHATPSSKSEALSLITANVTSWSTRLDAGVKSLSSKRSSSGGTLLGQLGRRPNGTWAAAKRIGPCGPASGGLATLVCETRTFWAVAPDRPGPHWKEGRWTHTAIGARGTHVHVINLYGWPQVHVINLYGKPQVHVIFLRVAPGPRSTS